VGAYLQFIETSKQKSWMACSF